MLVRLVLAAAVGALLMPVSGCRPQSEAETTGAPGSDVLSTCIIGRWDRVLEPSAHESATGFYRLAIDQETLTTDADWVYRLSVGADGQQINEVTTLTGTAVQGYQISEDNTIVGGRIARSVGTMSSTQWQGDSSPPPAAQEPFLVDYDGLAIECDPDFLRLSSRIPDADGESTVTLARVDP